MAYSAEQYAAAGAWIAANIGNPELVAQTAAAYGISIADLTIAAQTVDSSITTAQVESYLAPTSYAPPEPEPVYYAPEPVYYAPEPVYDYWAEQARLEAERQEAARQEALRQEAIRQEAARQEALRQEAIRQEAARQEALRLEALRLEAMRLEAERQEALRLEAERQEALRLEAERQEALQQSVYTPEQYAAAGAFIAANIDNPELIAQTAMAYGLTVDDLTQAAQTVDKTITIEQVENYLAPTSYTEPAPEPIVTTPEPVVFESEQTAMNYTPEQYAAAGQFILANLDNPALIAQTALEYGVSVADLTIAAQTVDPSITIDQVETYFDNADVSLTHPYTSGIWAFDSQAALDAYLATGDPYAWDKQQQATPPAPVVVTPPAPVVTPPAPVVVTPPAPTLPRPVVVTPPPTPVISPPVVSPVPVIPAPVNAIVPPATQTPPVATSVQQSTPNLTPLLLAAGAFLLLGG